MLTSMRKAFARSGIATTLGSGRFSSSSARKAVNLEAPPFSAGKAMNLGSVRFSSSYPPLGDSLIAIMGLVSRFVAGSCAGWGLAIVTLKKFLEEQENLPAKEDVEKGKGK